MSTLGERITYAREAKGLLQSELAQMINVKSSGVISNWETDKNKPDAEKIISLCRALDVTASYLLDYSGPETFNLSPEEKAIITDFRGLSPYDQKTIRLLLNRFSDARRVET